ncbi:MAG: hypothetical protein ACR2PG_25280 [Hyphomicrobiaceae bacterium]
MSRGMNSGPLNTALRRPGAAGLLAAAIFGGSSAGLFAADLYPYGAEPNAEVPYHNSAHDKANGSGLLGGSVRDYGPQDRFVERPSYSYTDGPYHEPPYSYDAKPAKGVQPFSKNYDKSQRRFGKTYGESHATYGKSGHDGNSENAYGTYGHVSGGHDKVDGRYHSAYGEYHKTDGKRGELDDAYDHATGIREKPYGFTGEHKKYSKKDGRSRRDKLTGVDKHTGVDKYRGHERYRSYGQYDQYDHYGKEHGYRENDNYQKHGGDGHEGYSGKHHLKNGRYGKAPALSDKTPRKHRLRELDRNDQGGHGYERELHFPLEPHLKSDDYFGSKRLRRLGKKRPFRGRSYRHRNGRYSLEAHCVPRRHVIQSLKSDGWYNFHGLRLRGRRAVVRASHDGGRYRLVIDRCYGHVIRAARIKSVRGYRRNAYRHPRVY